MSQVPTVRGPVEVADLGPTYMQWIDPNGLIFRGPN
jgi:hypothetical protein